MSGSHESLAESASSLVDEEYSPAFRRAVHCLLKHQYVDPDVNTVKVVLKGAGMGMSEAGDLSDACLYYEREKYFILDENVRRHYNIKLYVRFRDDVIMIRRPHRATRLLRAT